MHRFHFEALHIRNNEKNNIINENCALNESEYCKYAQLEKYSYSPWRILLAILAVHLRAVHSLTNSFICLEYFNGKKRTETEMFVFSVTRLKLSWGDHALRRQHLFSHFLMNFAVHSLSKCSTIEQFRCKYVNMSANEWNSIGFIIILKSHHCCYRSLKKVLLSVLSICEKCFNFLAGSIMWAHRSTDTSQCEIQVFLNLSSEPFNPSNPYLWIFEGHECTAHM